MKMFNEFKTQNKQNEQQKPMAMFEKHEPFMNPFGGSGFGS